MIAVNIRTVRTLGVAAVRSIEHLVGDRVVYPTDRLEDVLVDPDGRKYTVFRETALEPAEDETRTGGVVLVFRMSVLTRTLGTKARIALYNRLANVATPFFAGMPGFRRKLWLSGDRAGEFLELYEWASEEDAARLVTVLQSLLGPFDELGAASYQIVEAESIDTFVDQSGFTWQHDLAHTDAGRRLRRFGLVVAILVAGYVAWRWMTSDRVLAWV